jgi:hypothetical protein
MIAARDDTTVINDDLLRSPGPHSVKTEPIDAATRRNVVKPPSGTAEAPACTTAVDADRHIDGLADAITTLDNVPNAPAPVSDQELSRNVMMLLQGISAVPFQGIRTEIFHGCVTLLGAVASAAASKEIEQGVERLSGVYSVINRIIIQEIEQ